MLDRDAQGVDRLALIAQLLHQPAGMQKQRTQRRQLELPHPAIQSRFAPGAELGILEPALQLSHQSQVRTALQGGHHGPMGQLALPAQLLQHGLELPGLRPGELGHQSLLKPLAQHIQIPRHAQAPQGFGHPLCRQPFGQHQRRAKLVQGGAQPPHRDPHLVQRFGIPVLEHRPMPAHQGLGVLTQQVSPMLTQPGHRQTILIHPPNLIGTGRWVG